jgi:hypothetical protein
MWIPKRVLVTVMVAGIAAMSMALAVGALGAPGGHPGKPNHPGKPEHPSKPDHPSKHTPPSVPKRHGKPVIKESLAPSHLGDPSLHEVATGLVPWMLAQGEVRLKSDGMLDLRLEGLVISSGPEAGTPGPVTTISVSLYCGAEAETAAETTPAVALSRTGDARIHDASFGVPSTCLAPVILVHPNGDLTHYIALDGWRP